MGPDDDYTGFFAFRKPAHESWWQSKPDCDGLAKLDLKSFYRGGLVKNIAMAFGILAALNAVTVSGALAFGCVADNGIQISWATSKDTPEERKWVRGKAIEECEATRRASPRPGGKCVIKACSADVNTQDEAKAKWPM